MSGDIPTFPSGSEAHAARIPIIRLWDVLLVPIQGELIDRQAEQLRADVLHRVQETSASHLIVDVSGVWLMDSHLCMVLAHLAKAARFMGASTIITGLSPDVALTLQSMGLHVGTGQTMRSLEDAFEALHIMPRRVDRAEDEEVAKRILAGSGAAEPTGAPTGGSDA
jgi:rsbT antagonist protein RsbS